MRARPGPLSETILEYASILTPGSHSGTPRSLEVDMTAPTTLDLTGTWDLDPAHTRLGFAARHAMVATVRGNFGVFSVVITLDSDDPTRSTAEVRIDAASLTTGNEQRDTHLKSADFLDVEKYPELIFRSTRAEVVRDDEFKLYGELTIRDQSHPVVLDLEFQ